MSESTAEKKEENPFWRSSCLCFKTTWGHSPCEGGQRQRGSFAPQKAGGGGGGGERLHSWAAANAKTARWLLYIHTLTYAHTILHLQPLAEGDKQVRCPTRATSIPTLFFFTPYSSHPCISRSRITVTFTHMRIGSVIVKDAQIWQQESCKSCHRSSLKEKKHKHEQDVYSVRERESERERRATHRHS